MAAKSLGALGLGGLCAFRPPCRLLGADPLTSQAGIDYAIEASRCSRPGRETCGRLKGDAI